MNDEVKLSEEEIFGITGYRVAAYQLRRLKEMGIPAYLRRCDNTVVVLRRDAIYPVSSQPKPEPKLNFA